MVLIGRADFFFFNSDQTVRKHHMDELSKSDYSIIIWLFYSI